MRTSSTGLVSSTRSQARCSIPSKAPSVSIRYGTSSMIRTLAWSAGSAAASTSNAASQFSGRAAATSPANGSVDTSASLASRARSSLGDAPVAAKNKKGAPERSAKRSTSRDLPTRRRPRNITHRPGRSPPIPAATFCSSRSNVASSWRRPTKSTTPGRPPPVTLTTMLATWRLVIAFVTLDRRVD